MLTIAFVTCCNTIPDCRNEIESNFVKVKFLDSADSTVLAVQFESVEAIGVSSTLYSDTLLSAYELELNPAENSSKYTFQLDGSIDILELGYNRHVSIISEECGPKFSYDNLEIITHTFDSVAITSSNVDRTLAEHIEIYY